MSKKKYFFNLLTALLFIVTMPPSVFSYNTIEKGRGGHVGIADRALNFKMSKPGNEQLRNELSQNNNQKVKTVLDAVSAEDSPVSRTRNHFYNPITGKGLLGYFENARERAGKFYKSAVDSYCTGNKQKAWDDLF